MLSACQINLNAKETEEFTIKLIKARSIVGISCLALEKFNIMIFAD